MNTDKMRTPPWMIGIIAFTAGVIVLFALDRMVMAPLVPEMRNAVIVDAEPLFLKWTVPFWATGLISIVATCLLASVVYSLWGLRPKEKASWNKAWHRWCEFALLAIVLPFGLLVGNFIYDLVQGIFPDTFNAVMRSFGLTITPIVNGRAWDALDGSLASILGLIVAWRMVTGSKKGQ